MIVCIGMEADTAVKALENEGFSVHLTEVRSRGGVNGDSKRIIRQRLTEDGTVELCFSYALTTPTEENCPLDA
ncbi:MAG: hypothetical protein IJO93_05210 [Clostridia bacterium]|nr:hypothetical protein [Clostridia bacterium]